VDEDLKTEIWENSQIMDEGPEFDAYKNLVNLRLNRIADRDIRNIRFECETELHNSRLERAKGIKTILFKNQKEFLFNLIDVFFLRIPSFALGFVAPKPPSLKTYNINNLDSSRAETEDSIRVMKYELVEECYNSFQIFLEAELMAVKDVNRFLSNNVRNLQDLIRRTGDFTQDKTTIRALNFLVEFPMGFNSRHLYEEENECEKQGNGRFRPLSTELFRKEEELTINTKIIVPNYESYIKAIFYEGDKDILIDILTS
jgi:hypothetical protein